MSEPKVQHKATAQKKKGKGNLAEAKTASLSRHFLTLCVSLVLIVVILAVFWQVRNHEFIKFDDDEYVTNNPHVKSGINLSGVIWAFMAMYSNNWHPLTWLSHMLDCELYGLNPGGHHLTNLLIHVANTVLLFLVLKRMTGALWRSSFVAALFALHPLHVESVAWVSERKDVLSTFFWILTMETYLRYVNSPRVHRYLLVLLCFVMGFLSKPMLVTLPFVLLLLDYWPLGRFRFGELGSNRNVSTQKSLNLSDQRSSALHLVLEKTPFFVLSAVASILTFLAQQSGGTVKSLKVFPLGTRIANALVSYVSYIGKMIWPNRLGIFYPYPDRVSIWQITEAALLLGCVSVLVIRASYKRRYLGMGWLWYLGTLVPVIGLVQVGLQAMADRYTYVPIIGLFIMIVWGVHDIFKGWQHQKTAFAVSTGFLFSVLAMVTWAQVQHWQNSIMLFKHTLEVTSKNSLMHYDLGVIMLRQGRYSEAIAHLNESLRIEPGDADAHNNLGLALGRQGKIQEAMVHYAEALRIKPDDAGAHNNLGVALARQGKMQEAMVHYAEAVRIKPDLAEAYGNIGNSLAQQGKIKEAIDQYNKCLQINPDFPDIHRNLGICFGEQGRIEEAIAHFKEALRIKPNFADAHYSLALAYLMIGNRGLAMEEYEVLKKIRPDLANALSQKMMKQRNPITGQ
jgi:Flp pilus assembly protein TadD